MNLSTIYNHNDIKKEEEILRVRMESDKYHCDYKGCKIEERPSYSRYGSTSYKVNTQHCLTHNVEICHCGWQTQWHYGKSSKEIINKERLVNARVNQNKNNRKCMICDDMFTYNKGDKNGWINFCSKECLDTYKLNKTK